MFCVCAGCYAFSDQAGSEGGQTEGDQTGAAKFRKTQGEILLRPLGFKLEASGCFMIG